MNKKDLVTAILFGSLTVSGIMSAQSVYPGQHQGKLKKETVAPLQAESFDLKDVRLLPSRFRDNMLRDSAWMTSIYDSEETGWLRIFGLRTSRTYYRTHALGTWFDVRSYRQ